MISESYTTLLRDLRRVETGIVTRQLKDVRDQPTLRRRVEALWRAAEVGGTFEGFASMLVRRAAVRFLLRTLYVRVLEDLGALERPFLRGRWGLDAFRDLAPGLGLRRYVQFVFDDLAKDFPDLFGTSTDELPLPDEEGCKAIWDLLHDEDGERGLRYDFRPAADGTFDSRFLGDLYQDLDPEVKKRFALLQTPHFVESFILDKTLTPALVEFPPTELVANGKTFRLIDPTCGSGHFLIGGWRRLAAYWESQGLGRWDAARRALDSIWGADLNPHAIDIARFRLILEVMAFTGVTDLDRLRELPCHLAVLDSLVPWERGVFAERQAKLLSGMDRLSHYATPEERERNAAFLGHAFHVVVGNPPYITPKDAQKRDDYRAFWPGSAAGKYALSAPFVERLFVLGTENAFMGQITANSFMKRGFGRKLVEETLPQWFLTDVIDTSGAYIPGHGTPTVILIGRSTRPPLPPPPLRAILGKRGEPKRPADAANGLVWTAIAGAGSTTDDTNPFITVAKTERSAFAKHPWSLGGGLSSEILEELSPGSKLISQLSDSGYSFVTAADQLYLMDASCASRWNLDDDVVVTTAVGDGCRDYWLENGALAIYPYQDLQLRAEEALPATLVRYLHNFKAYLWARPTFSGASYRDAGRTWYEWHQFSTSKHATPLAIAFAFVSTHNHFVLDRGVKVFNRTAPILKLKSNATEDDHLDLLGLLNTSTFCFWAKSVSYNRGNSTDSAGARTTGEFCFDSFEFDSSKIKRTPLPAGGATERTCLARSLDRLGTERATQSAQATIAAAWEAEELEGRLENARSAYGHLTERMVALQEELDWLTYGSYGLIELVETVGPDEVEPLAPGHRPFAIRAAILDEEADDDEKSAWWTRHGHDKVTAVPDRYSTAHRARLEARLALIDENPRLQLLETFAFKRRWQLPDFEAEAKKAATDWLLDRLEALFAKGGPLSQPHPVRLETIVAALSTDPRVAAAAAVTTGSRDFDVTQVVERLLVGQSLPDHDRRLYTESGLRKRALWRETWAAQDREDAADAARAKGEKAPKVDVPVPPEYVQKSASGAERDFLRTDFYSLRGPLDVHRERFIAFEDVPDKRCWGWAGWRDLARAEAQLAAVELAKTDPTEPWPEPSEADPRRCGTTLGLWESLDDVRRWSGEDAYRELREYAADACKQSACPCDLVTAWQRRTSSSGVSDGAETKVAKPRGRPKKVTAS